MNLHIIIPSKGSKSLNSLLRFKDGEEEVKSPLPVTLTDGNRVIVLATVQFQK
jgi:hypothetical protein